MWNVIIIMITNESGGSDKTYNNEYLISIAYNLV
jgi:hypothetical protein